LLSSGTGLDLFESSLGGEQRHLPLVGLLDPDGDFAAQLLKLLLVRLGCVLVKSTRGALRRTGVLRVQTCRSRRRRSRKGFGARTRTRTTFLACRTERPGNSPRLRGGTTAPRPVFRCSYP